MGKLAQNVCYVDWTFTMSEPPYMVIFAKAQVSSISASNHRLLPRNGGKLSEDNYFEFDFISDYPDIQLGAIDSNAVSKAYFLIAPQDLVGIRVYGENNHSEKLLTENSIQDNVKQFVDTLSMSSVKTVNSTSNEPILVWSLSGGADTFPWGLLPKKFREDPDLKTLDISEEPIHSLIGHKCRVYYTGDLITQDFIPSRVNIEREKNTNVIVNIWMDGLAIPIINNN